MITHVITFKLSDESPDQAQKCKAMLDDLVPRVPSLRSMTVGINVVASPRAHTVALIATFDDLDGLEAYRVHPDHQAVAAYLRSNSEAIAVVDFES